MKEQADFAKNLENTKQVAAMNAKK